MVRIENWSAILASWLVILANLQAGSAEAELSANYRKVRAHANEDRSFVQALELNATPLTTHTVADSRVEGIASVVQESVRGDEWSVDNPQVGARRLGDEGKSLKTFRSEIRRREEPTESDQSDYPNSKKTRKKEIDTLKSPSTGAESSLKEDPTSFREEKTKEWSGLVNSKSLGGEDTRVLSDSRSSTIELPHSLYSRDSRDPLEHSAVRENRPLNPASKILSKSADRKVHDSFTLKTEQLQAHLETRTTDDVPESIVATKVPGTVQRREEYRDRRAKFDGDISQNATLVRNSPRFLDSEASKPTETSKVTGQSATIVAEERETSTDRKSDTHKLTSQRTNSQQSYSGTDNDGTTDQTVLPETGRISDFPLDKNMTKLPNPETTATPSTPFSTMSEYSPGELALAVDQDEETEAFTTSRHEDKSSYDSIKKERRAFGKLAGRATEEPTRFSSRTHWNEEDALVAPRDTTIAIEFQPGTSAVHFNTAANAVAKQSRARVRENSADHEAKRESRLPHGESVNVRFRADKRRGFSKQTLGTNKAEGKDRGEKGEDILHPTEGKASPGEAATTPYDTHWNVEQTDMTIGRPIKIENILAAGTASTRSGDADPSADDRLLQTGKRRKQLFDILGHNIASSGSSTQRATETNFRAGRNNNVLDEADIPPAEKRQASATRAGVHRASTNRIASKQDHLVAEPLGKDELNRNEDAVTAKATFHSQRASGELDYSQSSGAEADTLQRGLNSENKAIPGYNDTEVVSKAPNESRSTPNHPGKQSRSSIMRERNASDARREMTGRLTEAKAASNMEREDRPSIAARNVEVPYTNSTGGHPGDLGDQWIARNPKIARAAVLNLTQPAGTQEESTTDKETGEKLTSSPSPICDEREGKRECVNEDDKQDVPDLSTRSQVPITESSTQKGQLIKHTPGENTTDKINKSMANEATGKLIESKRTTEVGSNESNARAYTESGYHVNHTEPNETSAATGTTAESNLQDNTNGIPSVADALPERHSRDGELRHATKIESLVYTRDGSGSTLPQEADTERQQLDRASSDPPAREEYDTPGEAVTPTKIDSPPQTSSPSTAGIPSSSERLIALQTDKPVTRGIDMETLAAASTNWSGTYTYAVSAMESTTARETLVTIEESVEKKHNETRDKGIETSTEHWLNIEKKRTKTGNSSLDLLDQWPVKHSAVVEGDLVLGGLMMVHAREDTNTCGPVMPQGGVQALEAMLYTLDNVNRLNIVPGVKIGAHILDDCDKDTYGLEMAVDFIKGE